MSGLSTFEMKKTTYSVFKDTEYSWLKQIFNPHSLLMYPFGRASLYKLVLKGFWH
jgi:hypothetical protein